MSYEVIEQVLAALAMLALLCVPFYWHRLAALATSAQRTGGLLNDGDLGLAEIQLLPGWKGAQIPASTASIQEVDRFRLSGGHRFLNPSAGG